MENPSSTDSADDEDDDDDDEESKEESEYQVNASIEEKDSGKGSLSKVKKEKPKASEPKAALKEEQYLSYSEASSSEKNLK